ncbi:MAG TPA: nuclear transport factor 2 family protein [Ramlibacter sp.]|nr:nuclear transport factor 2 family protein [Ramlibacter sp.]
MSSVIETELRALIVKERLHELEMAYCRGVDRRDAVLLQSIFFDDAVEEHGDMYRGSAVEFVRWAIEEFLPQYENTTHYVLNEWYRVEDDRAEGETHRVSYHRQRKDGALVETLAACRTFNRYECRNGVWKISYRGVVRDWVTQRAADEGLYEGKFEMPMSRPDAAAGQTM